MAEVTIGFLQVDRDGIVNHRAHAPLIQECLQAVPVSAPDHVKVLDVPAVIHLYGRGHAAVL